MRVNILKVVIHKTNRCRTAHKWIFSVVYLFSLLGVYSFGSLHGQKQVPPMAVNARVCRCMQFFAGLCHVQSLQDPQEKPGLHLSSRDRFRGWFRIRRHIQFTELTVLPKAPLAACYQAKMPCSLRSFCKTQFWHVQRIPYVLFIMFVFDIWHNHYVTSNIFNMSYSLCSFLT